MSLEAAARLASSYTNLAKLALETGSNGGSNKFFGNNIDYAAVTRALQSVSEQLACGSCGSTAAAGTPYPDPNASGGVHGVLCEGCYNRRHRRGGNSSTGHQQSFKTKSRRVSQDTDEVDDDSLAAELLVSTVKNLRSLCAIMLDGVSEEDESSTSDDDTDPEVSFSPKSAASILSAGVGGISVLKTATTGKYINGNSHQKRRSVEKKCLERLKGFSNALNNVNHQQPQQRLQLTLLEKRRQPQQTILQHLGPSQVQRHHLMTTPSTITVSQSSNTPSNRIRQPITIYGGNLKSSSARLGGIVFNRRDSISLPPSPTRSLVVKKETLLSSGSGDPIVIQQPITLPRLPQVPLALHQTIIHPPRQYIHIKTEPSLTAAASNIPAQLPSSNTVTSRPSSIIIRSPSTEEIRSLTQISGPPILANVKKEIDTFPDEQCDNSNNSSPSVSPGSTSSNTGNLPRGWVERCSTEDGSHYYYDKVNKASQWDKPTEDAKGNSKRKGCRCGNATAMPGKLTCCGQRCPCYVDAKACFECKCKGCRNPHRPNGEKRPHSMSVNSGPTTARKSSNGGGKKAEKRTLIVPDTSTLNNQPMPTKLFIKTGSNIGTHTIVKRIHLGK